MVQKGHLARSNISETGEAMTTKIGLHAFHVNLYLHEFFEPILFFDPMDYSPWFEREIWPNLKRSKITKNEEAISLYALIKRYALKIGSSLY